jgi:aromatic ring-cleaving dioxygenase
MSVPVFTAEETGHTLVGDTQWMPTVTIDVSGSPLIADLARVHAVEGIGDVRSHALRENDSVLLGVSLTVPVQAMFVVAFSYTAHGQFLEEVAAAGMLLFATTDTRRAHEEKPLWLSIDIDGDALRQVVLSVGDEPI